MKYLILIGAVCTVLTSSNGFTAETKPNASANSVTQQQLQDQRQTMALMHEQMATCLKSDKTVDACYAEMRETCEDARFKASCPRYGSPMFGRMGGRGLQDWEFRERAQLRREGYTSKKADAKN